MRPYVPEDLRAINLAALEMVDYVIVDREATPLKNLALIQPDYFAKGYEYVKGELNPRTQEEIDALDTYGGEVIFTPGRNGGDRISGYLASCRPKAAGKARTAVGPEARTSAIAASTARSSAASPSTTS